MRKLLEQLQLDEWTTWVLLMAFAATFALFAFQMWRILTMKREKREHAAKLPLEPDVTEIEVPVPADPNQRSD
ncbi:MAG: hypothetical protein ACFB20_12295 [Opitutales bacterium]